MGDERREGGLLLAVTALVPAALAATRVANVADAARDGDVVRTLGLAPVPAGAFDTAVRLVLASVPVGTRAARAGLGGALVAGVAGAVLYTIFRALLDACATTRRLGSIVAAIAATLPLVGVAWQSECGTVGGAATGAMLALLPLGLLLDRGASLATARPLQIGAASFAFGLAVGEGPVVGACALAGAVGLTVSDAQGRAAVASAWRTGAASLGGAFAAGLAPALLGLARARTAGASAAQLVRGFMGATHGVRPSAASALATVHAELGWIVLLFAAAGVLFAGLVPRARSIVIALTALAVAGVTLGAVLPAEPSGRASVLVAIAAVCGLAAAGMQALVRAVAAAHVPMARASASMILLLELVLPVDAADEALARSADGGAVAAWDDAAWGELPPEAVVVLSTEASWLRANAARARGSLRGDVTVVPVVASGPAARRTLASDPVLLPLWRDLEMAGTPSEASLAAVAAARPLLTTYEPRWGRGVGSHLVPDGLFDRFALEPRGASDRRTALAAFAPRRERLERLARGDAVIPGETARLLRARALLFATLDAHDGDTVAIAVADVRAFSPDDPVAAQVVARAAGKGPARFDDLRP
jgi:hypothetical protein